MSDLAAQPRVSIIVPAYNGGERLRECLASLSAQDYPDYEVVFVDNGSTDGSREAARQFSRVRYVYFDRVQSSYAARNEGVRHATGEVLLFFDSDQTAPPEFLADLMTGYLPGDWRHIYPGRLEHDPRVPEVLRRFSHTPSRERPPERITTACVAVPRRLFEELGGFTESLLSFGDFEFFDRAGQIAAVHPPNDVACLHYDSRTVRDYLRREERYAYGACLIAAHRGAPIPSLAHHTWGLVKTVARSAALAVATPLRKPPSEWALHWRCQQVQCAERWRRVAGVLKYRLGRGSAGDLPSRRAPAEPTPTAQQ